MEDLERASYRLVQLRRKLEATCSRAPTRGGRTRMIPHGGRRHSHSISTTSDTGTGHGQSHKQAVPSVVITAPSVDGDGDGSGEGDSINNPPNTLGGNTTTPAVSFTENTKESEAIDPRDLQHSWHIARSRIRSIPYLAHSALLHKLQNAPLPDVSTSTHADALLSAFIGSHHGTLPPGHRRPMTETETGNTKEEMGGWLSPRLLRLHRHDPSSTKQISVATGIMQRVKGFKWARETCGEIKVVPVDHARQNRLKASNLISESDDAERELVEYAIQISQATHNEQEGEPEHTRTGEGVDDDTFVLGSDD